MGTSHLPNLRVVVEAPLGKGKITLDTNELRLDGEHITDEMLRQHGTIAWYHSIYAWHESKVRKAEDRLQALEDDLDARVRLDFDHDNIKLTEKAIASEIRRKPEYREMLRRLRAAQETLGMVKAFWEDVKQRGMTLHDLGAQYRAETFEPRTTQASEKYKQWREERHR